ncbi:cyclic nucleotide-binding domain-containing protein [Bdellovibrio bacteriovorus]|uniref:cyclic nucleotide-binding domain-containing protein n=1 Tax=Bdellovibrio bacteriovorus TaxID=959 RepID=UPI0035A6C075
MRFEKEQVQLQPLQLQPASDGGLVTVLPTRKSFRLSPLQYSYLDILKNGTSVEGLVQFFLGQGWLVNFRELSALLEFLVHEGILLNPVIRDYFSKAAAQAQAAGSGLGPQVSGGPSVSPQSLPFFRSLDADLAQFLLQKAERFQVPAHIKVIQSGKNDRDLFILLKGQAGIYRVMDAQHRQLVAALEAGALFGESGFLLNQPRTADVITLTPCEILRVRHLPEFDQLIKTEKAQSLQHRFWILQALQSSNVFKKLPGDCLDSLIFSGRLVKAPAHQRLFNEGQPANTCYIVVQGSVVISQQGRNINVMGQGACFGEISLLMSGGQRTASATTQHETVLLEIQQKDFYRVLSQNLFLAKEIETLAAQRLQADQQR